MFLRALGGLRLDGVPSTYRKPLALLCFLALEGRHDRRHLATLFWPGATHPRNRLSVTLSRLRRLVPGGVHSDGEWLSTPLATDVERLVEAVARGDVGAVRERYAGAFLEGVTIEGQGPELEAWILQRREEIAGRVQALWAGAAERAAEAERYGEAAALVEEALALPGAAPPDPALLARAHALLLAGESAAAAAVGREAAELGLHVVASRAEARARLRDDRPRTNLPRAQTSFVGRDHERAELGPLLGDAGRPLITLVGPGGIGKTRLALALAEDARVGGAFPGGTFFVPLEALTRPSAIPRAVAAALGAVPRRDEAPLDAVARAIGRRPTLLILDNVEHLVAGAELVAELLGRCPQLFVLATSRVRLELEEESVYPVGGLPVPAAPPPPADAEHHEAIRLFVDRARRVRLDYRVDADDLAAIVSLVRTVGGAPLGIELAAAGVRRASVAAVAAAVAASLDALAAPSRNIAERHRTLRASFDASWRLLRPPEREGLRRVAVFRGGFDAAAARAVGGVPAPVLAVLRDAALLQEGEAGRFELHPLIATYAAERLALDAELHERLRARHASWILERVDRWAALLYGPRQAAAMAALERDDGNVTEALAWAGTRDPRLALRLVGALRTFWRFSGRLDEGRERAEGALAVAPPDAHAERAAARLTAAEMAFRQGDGRAARRHVRSALIAATRANDDRLVTEARQVAGNLDFAEGWLDAAAIHFEAAVDGARARGDDAAEQAASTGLGRVAAVRGDLDAAQARFEVALTAAQRRGAHASVATAQFNLGAVARDRGDVDRAERHFLASLVADTELGDRGATHATLHELAGIAYARDDLDDAAARYREVRERCLSLGDGPGVARASHALGLVAKRQDRFATALAHYRDAADRWLAMGNQGELPPLLWALASLANARGRPVLAARLWGAEASLHERLGRRRPATVQEAHDEELARTRASLDPAAFEIAWQEGSRTPVAELLEAGLEAEPNPLAAT